MPGAAALPAEHFCVLSCNRSPDTSARSKEMHMLKRRTLLLLPLLLVTLAGLAACERTTIGKINANPDRYMNKEVGISGTVTDSYGVPFVGGAYELDDGTGKIWVISERGVPSRGARVGVKGRVFSGPALRGRIFGTALQEQERKSK
jgi:hypothetical protein